jgi:uncharacterized protein YigA (DUF484 family)
MSKQQMRETEPARPTEDQVVEHLLANPEFFERQPAVLAHLRLPHQRGTAAVSLVERQMLVLRERHAALEQKLHELIENGRANDTIAERMHRLTKRLLRARDAEAVVAAVETSLREDFGASRWLTLITDPAYAPLAGRPGTSVRVVPRGSAELRAFETFFESGRPRSGQVREAQREYLFGAEGREVGSAALIPLGNRASLGLLAVASHDTERFVPTMSTDFLVRIGELVTEALTARSA